jgi:hypothetical protein
MPVKLVNDSYFEVTGGQDIFQPTALEIYSVLFEGARELRGTPVIADEFTNCGIEFSKDTATPVFILEADDESTIPQIQCRLIGRLQNTEADMAHAGTIILDYIINEKIWTPLPMDTLEDAYKLLESVGLHEFGPIKLAQYMKLLRLEKATFIIEDRTHKAFQASPQASSIKRCCDFVV